MNRRDFLKGAALATAACGSPRSTPMQQRIPVAQDQTSIEVFTANLDPSPFAWHGTTLYQATATGQLWKWDLATMRRVDTFALAQRAFTVLPDGTLAAWVSGDGSCALHLLDASGQLTVATTPLCGATRNYREMLFAVGDRIYSVRDDEIMVFRRVGSQLEDVATIALATPNASNRGQMFALADSRFVSPGLHVLAEGVTAVRLPTAPRYARHLAASARSDELWYTFPTTSELQRVDGLCRVPLGQPTRDLARVVVRPHRIVHLSSHADRAAFLLASEDKTAWQVVVVEESGTERWRAAVPVTHVGRELGLRGAVVITATRVVLRAPQDQLLAWDANTGQPIIAA